MNRFKFLTLLAFATLVLPLQAQVIVGGTEEAVSSPTEGVITTDFVPEATMKADLLQMLANFMTYVKYDFQDAAATNSVGEACGCFKGENTMGSNEQGVRPNADLSMVCAFLYKFGKGKVTLPVGVSWDDVKNMARKSLIFAYSTHKANKLKVCAAGDYWGSVSNSDKVWESSLWSMSVAYSAYFQYDSLTTAQKKYVYNLVKAECDYELARTIPTGFSSDSKSEENGWETNILACALGLYPNDALAPQWYDRLRAFAINCYSQINDATDASVVDPSYNSTTVKSLYLGKNIYDDFTLQNHGYFHTSYQNVVMQELGESFLALKMFQSGLNGTEKWKTDALMHNNQNVMNKVLNKLALADGELAMPNGNDWSLFLYDQIASYATMACFQRDPNALMLENLAFKNIKARQSTTTDGSWLLRPDVGARRMGVQAHRVMMTWLMHEMASTADLTPTSWTDFRNTYGKAEVFASQNIVRANTKDRFTCFSWSTGLSSYTGYFTQNSPDKNKIIVPYRQYNTGNLLGWYLVNGRVLNATPVTSGIYELKGDSYTMNGVLNTNDASLTNHFALYSTPGNALIYLDYVKSNAISTIGARGGLLAISTDEFTKPKRTIYHNDGRNQSDGSTLTTFTTSWANIDNQIGIVTPGSSSMAFGDRANNNSLLTSKFYAFYEPGARTVNPGDLVDRRRAIYYSGISAARTKELAACSISLADSLPSGWNGVIATDPDSIRYLLISNFAGAEKADMKSIRFPEGAPVFAAPTEITDEWSIGHFTLKASRSIGQPLRVYVTSGNITAQLATDSISTYLTNSSKSAKTIGLTVMTAQGLIQSNVQVPAASRVLVQAQNGLLTTTDVPIPKEPINDVTLLILKNPGFDTAPVTYNLTGTLNAAAVNLWAGKGYTSAYSYNQTDWNNRSTVANNSTFTASFSYGSTAKLNAVGVPSTDKNGITTGACLGISSGWGTGNAVQFTQSVLMPPGKYVLTYDAYNGNTTSTTLISNLTGFRNGSTNTFDATTNIPASVWTSPIVNASFTTPFQGEISVGASCSSASSASGPKFFVDNIRILSDLTVEEVEAYLWNAAKDSAHKALDKYPLVRSGEAYNTLLTAMQSVFSSPEECVAAIASVKEATSKFLAAAVLVGVKSIRADVAPMNVYNMYGRLVASNLTKAEASRRLGTGLYFFGGEKLVIGR